MYRLLSVERLLRVLLAVCATAALVLAAACGSDSEVATTADDEESITEGFLVHRDGVTRVCEMLAESFPPQCGGASVRVERLDLDAMAGLQTAEGVTWSNEARRLSGRLSGDVLTVREPAAVAFVSPSPSPGSGDETAVEGFLVHRDGTTRLCQYLLESYPPQCGGSSVQVDNLALDDVAGLQSAEGVRWSDDVVRLSGRLSDGVLTVTAVGGGAPAPLPAKPTPTAGDSGTTAAMRNPDAPAAAASSTSSSSDSAAAAPSPPAGQQGNEEPDDVEGFLVHRNGVTRLCELLAESYPPQCGGSSVRVEGLDLNSVAGLTTAEGVTWSDDLVRLTGRLRDGVLTVS